MLFVEEGCRVISGKKTGTTLHGGGVDHTAWGMSGRGNEMRRWSWWNLKMKRVWKGEPTSQGQLRILSFGHESDLIELLKNEDLS